MSFVQFKAMTAAALLGAAVMSGQALAAPDFTIDESGIGLPATNITVDQFNTSLRGRVVQIIDGATNPFTETGSLVVNGYLDNGLPVLGTGLNNQYTLKANFQIEGTAQLDGNQINATFNSFTFSLYADLGAQAARDGNEQFDFGDEDILLATGTLSGPGTSSIRFNPDNNGDFDVLATFELTLTSPNGGDAFFPSPRPFYIAFNITGNVNCITAGDTLDPCVPASTPVPGQNVLLIDGGGLAQFVEVPEPATLGLIGIGLLGLGGAARRRKAA
jgi:hypothetical protein